MNTRVLSAAGVNVNTPVKLLYAIAPLPDAAGSVPTERSPNAIPAPDPPVSAALTHLAVSYTHLRATRPERIGL